MEYKDKGISFDKTFAGGGPLDLDKMYTETVNAGRTGNAAGLVILLASLNENCHLGLDYAQLFREPLASNVKKWVLDKRYTTQKINKLIGQNCLHHILQPDYLDLGSDACEALRGKMKELSLTDGWEPDSAQNYFIQHSRHDTYVPIQSVRGIFAWMKQKGFRPSIVPGKTSLQTNTVTIKPDHRASAGVWLMQTAAALQIWPVLYYENEQNRYFHEVVCDLNLMKVLRFLESKGIDLRRVVKAMQGAKKAGAPSFSEVLNEVSEQLKIINLTLTDLQEMLDDAGITSDDLIEVYNYLTTDPNAARSITPDGNMESIADLLLYYEQILAAWLLQAGIDVGYEE